jgi:hypothetical protein
MPWRLLYHQQMGGGIQLGRLPKFSSFQFDLERRKADVRRQAFGMEFIR